MPFECVHGTLGGVCFGPHMQVLARSPTSLLLWVPGHAYWSGRQQNYGAATLQLIVNRSQGEVYRNYRDLAEGGRLSAKLIIAHADAIDAAFGPGATAAIAGAVQAKRTHLIDGGGDELTPSHRELRRRRESTQPPAPKPPRFEAIGFTEDQVDRLMDAARDRLAHANDEVGQQVWRKLELLTARFRPRAKMKPAPLPPSGQLRL